LGGHHAWVVPDSGIADLVMGIAVGAWWGTSDLRQSVDEIMVLANRVVDCEWRAVAQYDDGKRTVSELAQQVMGVCSVDRLKFNRAFGLRLHDPEAELEDFKQAVKIIEQSRELQARR
jgi:hypothetical protein